jgi:hypothetical protein
MLNIRRQFQMLVLSSAVAFSGCVPSEHAGLPPDVRRELEAGRSALNSWIALGRSGVVPEDEVVIGLGYAERLRLGLGSPFRLVESALRDPRLGDSIRHQVAWALLARTLSGEAYEIDAVALDRMGLGHTAHWAGIGRHHLSTIEGAVTEARDPRAGELAVRLAYKLAAMEGSVPEHAPRIAARAAAMVRDREVARADVVRLLRSAEAGQGDPLRAIPRWRAERYFNVEAPVLTPVAELGEREALELAPRLAQAIRTLIPRTGESATRPSVLEARPSLLTPAVAARLEAIADSLNMPPQAPVAIAARTYRHELTRPRRLSDAEREQRQRYSEATTEELFVARHAQLSRTSVYDAAPSLTALWTAVALRPYAQEAVWFPGFGGPTARELEERFGFAHVRFSDDVPAEWRPYFRGMLESSVRDMQRVLPALDLRGLGVRFGNVPRGEATLAMHDPRTRELVLPPGSSAGTLAHEIAHDLDWQVALRRYRVRGDYASDRASRNVNDRLAVRVRNLAQDATLDVPRDGDMYAHAHAQRPAENFARAVDWFVAASLAAQGRTNGYLSSVQDGVLTGYGTVRPPDVTGRAGDALINILDEVAPLYPDTRESFLRGYGSARALDALDLMRKMLEVRLPGGTPNIALVGAGVSSIEPALATVIETRNSGFAAIDDWICRAPGGAYDTQLEQARRWLVVESAASRARGVALQHARVVSGEIGARWVARRLYGGPWPAQELDEGVEALLLDLVERANAVARMEVRRTSPSFELLAPPSHCSALTLSLALAS